MKFPILFATRSALIAFPALLCACGGGSIGSAGVPSNTSGTVPPASGPQEPTLTVTTTAIKTFHFAWADVAGETEYRLLEDPDGASGYTPVATLPADTTRHDHTVFLPERINARYILQACRASVCTDSPAIHASGDLVDSIGYVKASNPADNDRFGGAVALSADGTTLAVGAPSSGATNGNSGTVYVFTRDGTTWRQQVLMKAPTPLSDDLFGFSLAFSSNGDTLAVGAPQDSGIARYAGAAFVFTRSGSDWQLQARVSGQNIGGGNLFGGSVALSSDGDTLAVGAKNEAGNSTGINNPSSGTIQQSGAAYVFKRTGTAWSQQAYIKASHTQIRTYFGSALALSANGHTLAVGASGESSLVAGSGAVFIFTRDGDTWSQQTYVKASNPDFFTRYGEALALSASGDVLAVGSALENSGATGIDGNQNNFTAPASGAVYVYARDGATWSQQAYVKASNTEEDDLFGSSLALSADGRLLAVGAHGEDSAARGIAGDQGNNGAYNGGAAYVFRHTTAGWRQQSYVKASNTVDDHVYRFGMALSLSGDGETLAVGCPRASNASAGVGGDQTDTAGSDVGAVYLY